MGVVVGGHGAHLLHLGVVIAYRLALGLEISHNGSNGFVDTLLQVHGVGAGGHVLEAHVDDGLGQHGCGSSTVTGLVVGLGGNLFHHLCTHVLELVFQLHFLGYGYAVLGDLRSTKLLGNNHVAALGAQGNLNGVSEGIGTFLHGGADVSIEFDFFCHSTIYF